jgi:integrase
MKKHKRRYGVEYRANRKRWGYRFCFQGHSYARYAWETREEAKAALIEFKKELGKKPEEPQSLPTALIVAVNAYLADSAADGRSEWRLDGVRWNFNKVIIPFFGASTPIGLITAGRIKNLLRQRKRVVKPKTVWHDITNLRAFFNWACSPRTAGEDEIPALLAKNPVDAIDNPRGSLNRFIGNTKPTKAELNLANVERAASVLESTDRAYFDFLRFTGLRKDEANRLRWDDISFDTGSFHCRGTKTDESDAWLPLAPLLIYSLKTHRAMNSSDYVFPGRSAQTRGKKIYSRRKLFEKIERLTSSCADCDADNIGKRRLCRSCGHIEQISRIHRCSKCKSAEVTEGIGCLTCGSSEMRAGVKLRPKDLRDYFASTVETKDPRVLMALMRHTNLTTTTKYLQAVRERMKDAVNGFGMTNGYTLDTTLDTSHNGQGPSKTVQDCNSPISVKVLSYQPSGENGVGIN